MKYKCTLIVVEDMVRSRKFYEEILGQKVILDFGENITFSGDFSLQTRESWVKFIGEYEDTIIFRPNNFELYFEEKKFDDFIEKIKSCDVEMLHEVIEYPWAQRVVRFYDPDKHMIEVGESMVVVAKRLAGQGLTLQEISEKTQHPVGFIVSALQEKTQKKLVGVKRD